MPVTLLTAIFLASYGLWGCNGNNKHNPPNVTQDANPVGSPGTAGSPGSSGGGGAAQLSALSVDEAEKFVKDWCGSGVLTNLRKLDAAKYLVSDDMPSWLNVVKTDEMDSNLADDEKRDESHQEQLIGNLKKFPVFNAMFPTGKMILADFSSGSGCRNTLVAIDALAAAYLKKLKDASSANALTCERKSKGGYHNVILKAPGISSMLSSSAYTEAEVEEHCDGTLAHVLVGHASSGTLTVSSVQHPDAEVTEPTLFDFTLASFILEADGSAQFLRSDGAAKFFYSDFHMIYRRQSSDN